MTIYKEIYSDFTSEVCPSTKFRVLTCVPEDFQADEKLPMIVFLHGAGERGVHSSVKAIGVPKYQMNGLPVRAVVLCPQILEEDDVWNTCTKELMELIKKTAEEYHADQDRISLTGLSMGGYGTWEMGMRYPEYFSCLAPLCGGGISWRAEKLKNMPIRAFHGDADQAVPVENSYEMADAVNRAGGQVKLAILHGCDHNCWDYAYEETNLLKWLVSNKRK